MLRDQKKTIIVTASIIVSMILFLAWGTMISLSKVDVNQTTVPAEEIETVDETPDNDNVQPEGENTSEPAVEPTNTNTNITDPVEQTEELNNAYVGKRTTLASRGSSARDLITPVVARAAEPPTTSPTSSPEQYEEPTVENKVIITDDPLPTPEPDRELIYLGNFKITHYCVENYHHICNDGDATQTASGERPVPYGTIAVDRKLIKLGSTVVIDGKEYRANDTGGAINGKRIDICVTTHKEANALGIKYKDVYLVVKK